MRNWCSDVYPTSDPGCGKDFASLADFDAHFLKDKENWPHCRSTADLTAKDWEQDEKGLWRSPSGLVAAQRAGRMFSKKPAKRRAR